MKILVTGNRGYIGSVLTQKLLEQGYDVVGFDTDYYGDCRFAQQNILNHQIAKDIRHVTEEDLEGMDTVIHLAALSNDPLGELDVKLTHEINFKATVQLATLAKKKGVRRFIYSSSQSMYGISNVDHELEEDKSEKNPLTAYAKTKWEAECAIKKLGDDKLSVVCLRPSTVFGKSPNMRCDIVFNNLVASAYTTGTVEIKSDGSPWRPVVHIEDVCSAFIACIEAPKELISNQSFNVGIPHGNFQIREMAQVVSHAVKNSKIIFAQSESKDSRTYRVCFDKIFKTLHDYYRPKWDLIRGGEELVAYFDRVGLTQQMFTGRQCNRLAQLKYLRKKGRLDEKLFWRV